MKRGRSLRLFLRLRIGITIAVMLASSRQTGNTSAGDSGGFACQVKMAADTSSPRECLPCKPARSTPSNSSARPPPKTARLSFAALADRGEANIIVATGASQFEMLDALARQPDIAWHRVTGFHLDEYAGLPITHPASFRLYLWQRFVSRLPLPLADFHFLDGAARSAGRMRPRRRNPARASDRCRVCRHRRERPPGVQRPARRLSDRKRLTSSSSSTMPAAVSSSAKDGFPRSMTCRAARSACRFGKS